MTTLEKLRTKFEQASRLCEGPYARDNDFERRARIARRIQELEEKESKRYEV